LFYLVMAIGFGLIAMFAANAALTQFAKSRGVTFQRVVVAAQDIPSGASITREQLMSADVNVVPRDAVSEIDQVVGKWSRYPIVRGEVVSASKILALEPGAVSPGAPLPLSAKIPSGMFAFNMPVNWLSGPPPPGLRVGDRVEIIAFQAGGRPDQSGVILTNMEILDLIRDSQGNAVYIIFPVKLEQAMTLFISHLTGIPTGLLLRPLGSLS
jgi:Flp pilus assembly protein CpaB